MAHSDCRSHERDKGLEDHKAQLTTSKETYSSLVASSRGTSQAGRDQLYLGPRIRGHDMERKQRRGGLIIKYWVFLSSLDSG